MKMTEDEKDRLLRAVVDSLEFEQKRRNQIAAARGWSIHPNDMELEPVERARVLEAWQAGGEMPSDLNV